SRLEDNQGSGALDAEIHGYHAVTETVAIDAARPGVAERFQHCAIETSLRVAGSYRGPVFGFPTRALQATVVFDGLTDVGSTGDDFQSDLYAVIFKPGALAFHVVPQILAALAPIVLEAPGDRHARSLD